MIIASVADFSDILGEFATLADTRTIARMVNRDITPIVESRLGQAVREVPPPRNTTKFVWSYNRAANNRARRWWFAAIKRGEVNTDGSHYLRTNTIVDHWETEIAINGNEILLSLLNDAPGAERVYGSPEINQVPGHATTGWRNYQYFLSFIEAVQPELVDAYENLIQSSIKRKR